MNRLYRNNRAGQPRLPVLLGIARFTGGALDFDVAMPL
jgi:hypothetical protein